MKVVSICKLSLGNVDKRCEEDNFTISVSQNKKNKRMSLGLSSNSYWKAKEGGGVGLGLIFLSRKPSLISIKRHTFINSRHTAWYWARWHSDEYCFFARHSIVFLNTLLSCSVLSHASLIHRNATFYADYEMNFDPGEQSQTCISFL
jgi:hypothetical protein